MKLTLFPRPTGRSWKRGLAAALLPALAGAALADDDIRPRVAPEPRYVQECGSCHVPYPVGMLPAASWRRLMEGLPQHFGSDASLDPTLAASISAWLQAHGARGSRAAEPPPEDRITRSRRFVREHDEIRAATWRSAPVKSAANCAACHPRAEQGGFDERDVRIPR